MYNGTLFSNEKERNPVFATTWMNLKDMLSDIIQAQKDKYCMISLIFGI